MKTLQIIKKLEALCKQGKIQTWEVGQSTISTTGRKWYLGWIHFQDGTCDKRRGNTLWSALYQMLKLAKEGKK